MGNRPRIDKLPDHGAVPTASGPGAQRACLCAEPPEIPPRSWRAAALDAPRMFALLVAPIDDLDDLADADVPENVEDALAGLLDETSAAAAVRSDVAPDEDAAAKGSVGADRDATANQTVTDPDDQAEGVPAEGDGQPGDVVAWGLSFPERAVLFLHNPLTGQDDFGIFKSPELARRFYSLFGELHLVYV